MTAIFLIFFSILFYQLLIKPALNPKTSPSANSKHSRAEQKEHLMRMWRNLQTFQDEKKEGKQPIKTKKAQPKGRTSSQRDGLFQGGEYIDYEEM